MKTSTITDFRTNMKERLQEIEEAQDILILSGPKKRDFVVMSLDQFNSMEETVHLLSTQANTQRLLESIAQDKASEAQIREIKLEE
ncbi:MAG: type II toxin-antitoxin system Phd/YefM family antitoxin [Algoriphagus sp.]|uniref:type II toxin-antitoxin system Phd/YefM family antitoxin n=1 Tax=Algoriphagus sp. TaxID=1872435 RepID=UPI002722EC5F|nr:type II toxin-antitoxin system Phd/YefM family antitoxin [Algoriphagus sp.]MDO8965778.1 type II toxin-antitoxin system Phd/YefM family antitoxin [Algoriphagus sp.]MDP2040348.1 type II toxin-antitoxin system Phd/YefM family antitoxin [Algoriphagus sp.]MDP3198873.1 type II toxin-antitoxin system Phd/YefM family antitoxin [Algoriphagus sp.]MDP3473849.1 type II toxin-antitoxin system Phd/YefM family antitoxin [Algoriphagus sp.]